jgi:hypothetical protein
MRISRGRPWRRCEMLAGTCSRWLRNAPAPRMRKWLLVVRRASEFCSPSTRISASLFFTEGFQREVVSSCSGSFPNLLKKWRTPPWHCFSLSPTSAGLFALSHESEFESGQCVRPRSVITGYDASKNSYMYRRPGFFVPPGIQRNRATAREACGGPIRGWTPPRIQRRIRSPWSPKTWERSPESK